MTAITPELLKQVCKQNGGYAQPTLNDQLYLQCKGFIKIEHLEPYTQLKVLWLEQNAITNIEGLDTLSKLVSLFLQNNTIRRMTNLTALGNLRILNLSHNYISKIEGLAAGCPLLESLQISHNVIPSLVACEELWGLPELSSVDLSFNKLERVEGADDMCIVSFFKRMPNVSVIYLQGNPLSHGMKFYRKNMIVHLPQLTYLDERPVFPDERRATEAWGRGGDTAEADERAKIRSEKKAEISNCVQTMAKAMEMNKEARDKQNAAWQQRRAEELEELKARRQEWRRQQQLVDAAEFDARGALEADEEDERLALDEELERRYSASLVKEQALRRAYEATAEAERVRQAANSELREEEERISAVLDAQPLQSQARASSMQYWIKLLDQTDEQIVASMEQDLESFLSELQPGFKMPALGAAALSAQSTAKQLDAKPLAAAVVAAAPQTAQQKKASKERMWEQYYRWENAHSRAGNKRNGW
jgi:hypothetical protein